MATRVRALAMAAALTLLAAGCTGTPPPVKGPTSVQATPTSEQTPNQIVVGVDEVTGGYNPHALADVSTTTTALAQLLLPAVFRTGSDGKPTLDKTLMRSAKVVDWKPFTVAYTIRQDASWSDGAPIAAEDFAYLAEEMRTQPGTVNPAGYRLIREVESHEGGKRVVVRFTESYPGWRTLFADLLPSHLLKDIPGGWQDAMESSYPSFGGPFAIKTIDPARGEILIERNERYWEKPSAVDQLLLRRTDDDGPASALRKGNNQFALTTTDAAALGDLRKLGKRVELHTVPRPFVAEVQLRPASRPLSDEDVRAAVAALIDRAAVVRAAGVPQAKAADAQVLAPSDRGYVPSVPPDRLAPNPARAAELLRKAGYTRGRDGWMSPDGEPLSLTVASPGEREPYARMATEIAEQLNKAGVATRAVQPDARDLFAEDPADADAEPVDVEGEEVNVDLVVAARAVDGADPASSFASRFVCRTSATREDGATEVEPGNALGHCDGGLHYLARDILTGQRQLGAELSALEPRLWRANVSIPLYQLADTLALGQEVAGVTEGPPLAGPFGEAVNWIRITE